mgnify:CR=1 FL=1
MFISIDRSPQAIDEVGATSLSLPRHRRAQLVQHFDVLPDAASNALGVSKPLESVGKSSSLPARLWQYQRERFPLHKHGLLVAAFSFAGMSLSAALRGNISLPSAGAFLVCFATTLSTFLMLRIADEYKDRDDDAKFRPYLPVPRGLVTLPELSAVFKICALLQFSLNAIFCPQLLLLLAGIWSYLFLMSKEFFASQWLRRHPVVYLLSHMVILPLVDAYITACDWLPSGHSAPIGVVFFLCLSFFNGLVLELGRKIRSRQQEEVGVDTYSAIWGLPGSLTVWSVAVSVAALFTIFTAAASGTLVTVSAVTLLMLLVLHNVAFKAAQGKLTNTGEQMEKVSASWLLTLYLSLGFAPFFNL